MNIKKLISVIIIGYAATQILNIAGILVVLQKDIPAKIVNYFFPVLAALSITFLSIKRNSNHLKPPFIFLTLFFAVFFAVSTVSTLAYSNFIHLPKVLPIYIKIIFGLFVFIWFFRNVEYAQSIIVLKYVSVFFFLAGLSIPVFFLLGFEMRDFNELSNLDYDKFKYYVNRPSGVDGNANNASIRSNIAVLFCLFWVKKAESQLSKVILLIVFVLLAVSVIMTFSNTGMLTLLGLILVFIYKQNYKLKKTLAGISLSFLLFFCVGVYAVSQFNIEFSKSQKNKIQNLYKLLTLDLQSVNYSQRDDKVSIALTAIKKNPIIGKGLGEFKNKFSVHNTYLMILGESGVIPLLLYLLLITSAFYYGLKFRYSPYSFLILGWAVIMLINSISNHNIITREYIFFPFLFYVFTKNGEAKKPS